MCGISWCLWWNHILLRCPSARPPASGSPPAQGPTGGPWPSSTSLAHDAFQSGVNRFRLKQTTGCTPPLPARPMTGSKGVPRTFSRRGAAVCITGRMLLAQMTPLPRLPGRSPTKPRLRPLNRCAGKALLASPTLFGCIRFRPLQRQQSQRILGPYTTYAR